MSYEVILTEDFKKFFKRLNKKYPSLRNDLLELIDELEKDFTLGIPLGANLYKIRLAIKSKNKGKSGGGRVIYYFLTAVSEIYLIHIFDKSEFENIPKEKILELMRTAGLE
ncbi:type II toxin-antitoxin system RelE/ParE family toxin [Algoriphagus sp. H41]|uniref:Type II toxin-antitoxin system RelE/ParE family toxin n=1 Tax=Algoriphagus oliviformis TaxID=2811231 RepID=A0ABS3C5X9_9BACT|nr:type II toxin-antitoxin system RelE/ParE family toxin [Algoriphagus oliviformis]MBN7810999.1 type II toxin-antitoxin system RelE/ParE family toxin [Algoriphagus oliviformis]